MNFVALQLCPSLNDRVSNWSSPILGEDPECPPHEPQAAWPPPEQVAAIVNALVVLFIPLTLLVAFFVHRLTDMNPPVRPPGNYFFSDLAGSLLIFVPLAPFALIPAWRTWTHARVYLAGKGGGWQGVIEGGALGLFLTLAGLIRPALTRPQQAPPYLIAYGGMALVVGLALGCVLRLTALLTLRIVAWFRAG